jgi:hypothetical protein
VHRRSHTDTHTHPRRFTGRVGHVVFAEEALQVQLHARATPFDCADVRYTHTHTYTIAGDKMTRRCGQ